MRIPRWWLFALLGMGCAHSSKGGASSSSSSAADYYPLSVGNRWTYEAKMLGEKSERTVEINGVRDGFYVDSAGGALTVDVYGVRDPKRYLLRNPVEKGNSWTNVVSVSSTERYVIDNADFPCEALAGKFPRCVRVQGRNRVDDKTHLLNEFTFAQGVGLVRIEVFAERDKKKIRQTSLELTSFQLAGKGK
jgi:hypothetical protein